MIKPGDIFYCPCTGCGEQCLAYATGYDGADMAGYVRRREDWGRALWIPSYIHGKVRKDVTDEELAFVVQSILLGKLTP